MIFALPLPFLIFEMICFFWVVSQWGFLTSLGIYFLPSFLGILLLSLQSRAGLAGLQQSLAQGKEPGHQILAAAANFVAGLFLLIPTLSTRVVAILLLLPGVRQIVLFILQIWMTRKMFRGAAQAFGANPFFRAEFRAGGNPWANSGFEEGRPRMERDATVIDVEPLEIEHSEPKRHRDS